MPVLVAVGTLPSLVFGDPAGLVAIDPADPHRFVMDGVPWYAAGYYPGVSAITTEQADYDRYARILIDRLSANRLNSFRNVFTMVQPFGDSALAPYLRTGPGRANDGRPRFDLTRFDESYFDHWRNVILYARSKGVVVQLCIFDSWHNKGWVVGDCGDIRHQWGMKYDFYHGANNINGIHATDHKDWHDPEHPVFAYQKALVCRVVDRVGDLPNIIYEISNESPSRDFWEIKLANHLTRYEASKGFARHLVMPRDLPNHFDAGGNRTDPRTAHRELVSNFPMNKPLIADSDGPWWNIDPNTHRKRAWAVLTAGGHVSDLDLNAHDRAVLESPQIATAMRYMGMTRKFLRDFNVDLRGMKPSDDRVTNGWCYAERGVRSVIYLVAGGSTTVSDLPVRFRARWFNARDGFIQAASGGPRFTAPDTNDWVLYIASRRSGVPVSVVRADTTRGDPPLTVNFDGTGSHDPDGRIIRYAWDFGDGGRGIGARVDHRYRRVGVFTATLTVTDNDGLRDAATVRIKLVPDTVLVDLGTANAARGMSHLKNEDGETIAVEIGGRNCRRNRNPNGPRADKYFYFSVGDFVVFQGNHPEVGITIEYYDTGTGTLVLQYDSDNGNDISARYKERGRVALTGSETWKQHTFHVTDAYFGNRQNGGADFRIHGAGSGYFYLDTVQVTSRRRPPG